MMRIRSFAAFGIAGLLAGCISSLPSQPDVDGGPLGRDAHSGSSSSGSSEGPRDAHVVHDSSHSHDGASPGDAHVSDATSPSGDTSMPTPDAGSGCPTCECGETCQGGVCVYASDCTGIECGPDKCGKGSCGSCTACGNSCQGGACVYTSSCNGAQCGSDACGQSCGTCTACGTSCQDGACVYTSDCTGRVCGPDACGQGSCGADPGANYSCVNGQVEGACYVRCCGSSAALCGPFYTATQQDCLNSYWNGGNDPCGNGCGARISWGDNQDIDSETCTSSCNGATCH